MHQARPVRWYETSGTGVILSPGPLAVTIKIEVLIQTIQCLVSRRYGTTEYMINRMIISISCVLQVMKIEFHQVLNA